MLAPFPHRYSASLSRTFASRARIEAPPRATLLGDPSPEFDGEVSAWPAEHMLLSSLVLGMLTTLETFAARDGIELLAWRAQVNGTVDQTPEGPTFTSIVLELDVEIAGNVDQFEDTLENARRYCLVHNALRVPVVVETSVRTPFEPLGPLGAVGPGDADLPRRPRVPAGARALHAV